MSTDNSASNDTKNYTVTLVILYNGTYITKEEDPTLRTVEIAYLVIVFLISFVSNVFLLVTITSSYTLRKTPFNVLLANLSVVFLIECLVNISIALLYTTVQQWRLGIVGCNINSFVVQMVTLEVTFSLTLLCAEGVMSVWQPFRFQSYLTVKKQLVAITTMWTVGILLCVPLLLQPACFFPYRFGCAPSGDGFVHALFLTIWCYCLMIALGFGCLVSLGVRQCNEYKNQRRKTGLNYTDVFAQGDLWTEWVNFKLVAWLFLFYLILELPYIVVHQERALTTNPIELSNNSTKSELRGEKTSKNEKAFTCFRYLYSCLFALLTFKMRKDIRHKFKALFTCCERRVRAHSAAPTVKPDAKKIAKKDSDIPLSLNTPVLYISPDGLCLRQLNNSSNASGKGKGKGQPKFLTYLCDLENSITDEDVLSTSNDDQRLSNDSEVHQELMGSSEKSERNRRFSKESEMTLPDMGSGFSDMNQSDKIPLTDIGLELLEQRKQKKMVRFSDTLTIFRSLTPRSPTPPWIVKAVTGKKTSVSKIPVRKVDKITPWKVELNDTYTLKTAESKSVPKVLNKSKPAVPKSSVTLSRNRKTKLKKSKFSSPPKWKIRKLP